MQDIIRFFRNNASGPVIRFHAWLHYVIFNTSKLHVSSDLLFDYYKQKYFIKGHNQFGVWILFIKFL